MLRVILLVARVTDILSDMYYYKVLIGSSNYHGSEALTYCNETEIKTGTIVQVQMRNAKVSGIIVSSTDKPKFKVRPILGIQISKSLPEETFQLLEWLGEYYPAPGGTLVTQFVPSSLPIKTLATPKTLIQTEPTDLLPELNKSQKAAVEVINKNSGSCLLHGDTGTGKTRVYLEMARNSLEKNENVVILTPEIGLTSQLADTVRKFIQAPVVVFHSNLTIQQRRTLWLQILYATEPLVVIGPRSALFVPISNIGLIVVDEAHDNAYKQDQAPRYHALRVASKLAQIHKCRLIFGTATPLVNEYFIAETKKLPIIRMTELAAGPSEPINIQVINARDRSLYSKNPYLSDALLTSVNNALENGQQSLVFLNRRGTARLVICQNCDWHSLCPNCNIPLTYHGDSHLMRCHTCGHKSTAVTSCPVCSSPDVVFKSIGTKAITASLESMFPGKVIKRFDTDNLRDEKFEIQYQEVKSGKVDILVGTQMLVKGLDLPRLGMVGVVAADSSLYFPDYTAEEQTFQLLTQVIGRVGRGHNKDSSVVIQTYDPSGRALNAAVSKDWDKFYRSQLEERKKHHFPPYFVTVKLHCSRKTQQSAIKSAGDLRNKLLALNMPIEIVGPTPRFQELVGGLFNWQLIVRAKNRNALLEVVRQLPSNWSYDLDPLNLL